MPEPIQVTTTYRDQANKKSTNTLYVEEGLTSIQMTEGLQILAVLIDDAVNGVITALDYTIDVDLSTLTGNTTEALADVEEVGEFISRTAQGREVAMRLPCITDVASAAGSDDLDDINPNIAAIISLLEDGIATVGGTIIPTDIDENDLVQVVTARERIRNTGKRG